MAKTQTGEAGGLAKAEVEKKLADIERRALDGLEGVRDPDWVAARMQTFLGRNGEMNRALEHLVDLPKAERAEVGRRGDELQGHPATALAPRPGASGPKAPRETPFPGPREAIEAALLEGHLREEALDVTLPGRPVVRGRVHPAHWMIHQITKVWAEMGFQVYLSREVETDEFNFTLLNMPPHHPARGEVDTFYTTDPQVLLRTHTSPGQIHVMRERAPAPIRVVLPGMCYRYEQVTARSEIQFNQMEGPGAR